MINIGKINTLTIARMVEFGAYLFDKEDIKDDEEVLLPRRYVPKNVDKGDDVEVFIYHDSEDRLIATTQKPFATLGEVAMMEVVSVTSFGAFVDWGLDKDLLVPIQEQKHKLREGDRPLVYIYTDSLTDRMTGSTRLEEHQSEEVLNIIEGTPVDIIVMGKIDIGYRVWIETYQRTGLLYKSEVFHPLYKGDKSKAYVKKVREDNKIDLSIHKMGYKKVDNQSDKIMKLLENNDGFISLTDKSPPEAIYRYLGISKKSFKIALGSLYKRRLISLETDGIRLTPKRR